MTLPQITPCVVHFRTCDLAHFERAWWSLAHQRYAGFHDDEPRLFRRAIVFDNNSETPHTALWQAAPEPQALVISEKRGEAHPERTHPYSVNRVLDFASRARADWILFTRSDYILAPDCTMRLLTEALSLEAEGLKPFVSGWCYQSAYTREQQDLPTVDPDSVPWREDWSQLVDRIPGYTFHETDQDAGVWLTRLRYLDEAGPMNEQLSAWGYAQSTYQRELKAKAGVTCVTVPKHLFFHQHHGVWARDFTIAQQQYDQFGGGR